MQQGQQKKASGKGGGGGGGGGSGGGADGEGDDLVGDELPRRGRTAAATGTGRSARVMSSRYWGGQYRVCADPSALRMHLNTAENGDYVRNEVIGRVPIRAWIEIIGFLGVAGMGRAQARVCACVRVCIVFVRACVCVCACNLVFACWRCLLLVACCC